MSTRVDQIAFDPRSIESLLLDKSNLKSKDYARGVEVLLKYSKIPADEIASHIVDIQRRAYALCPYPCIGLLRFLICSLSEHYSYPTVLARVQDGASLLDLGCCLAQDIRRLSHDGASTENCVGVDLEGGFFPLGEELFLDKDRISARFYSGNIFSPNDSLWTKLQGTFDIVHASSFFHLFGLEKQKIVADAVCQLVKSVSNSMVLGLQVGAPTDPGEIAVFSEQEPSYCHSQVTMQQLWDEAGVRTGLEEKGLRWEVTLKHSSIPEHMRIGGFANPRLADITWAATLVDQTLQSSGSEE